MLADSGRVVRLCFEHDDRVKTTSTLYGGACTQVVIGPAPQITLSICDEGARGNGREFVAGPSTAPGIEHWRPIARWHSIGWPIECPHG